MPYQHCKGTIYFPKSARIGGFFYVWARDFCDFVIESRFFAVLLQSEEMKSENEIIKRNHKMKSENEIRIEIIKNHI